MNFLDHWQWWQWVGAGLGILGLSPAPWIAAVLTGRLLPLSQHAQRVADIKEAHKSEVENLQKEIDRIAGEREYERAARATERERGDAATDKLSDFAQTYGRSTVGLLAGLDEANRQRTGAPSAVG